MASNLGIALTGIISSSGGIKVRYWARYSNANNFTTYTFAASALGGPGLCVVSVESEIEGSTARIVNSVTIGGLAATEAAQVNSALNVSATTTAIFYLADNANTSADIVVTFDAAPSRCSISIFRIQNNTSNTPFQTQTNTATSGTGLSLGFTALSAGAVGIAVETIGTNTITSATWTNATVRFTPLLVGFMRVTGATFTTQSSGDRTVSVSHTDSTQPLAMAGAVWV